MSYNRSTYVGAVALMTIIAAIVGLIGWVLNIVSLCQSDAITGMVVARVVGVFFPILGAVLGYF